MDAIRTRKFLGSTIYDADIEIGRIKYLIIDKNFIKSEQGHDFFVEDMVHIITTGIADRLIYITEVFVHKDYRLRYFGTELIQTLIDAYDDCALILRASALICEYPEEPTPDELNDIVSSLIPFFNKNGFVSINQYCGFEHSEAMLCIRNDIGRDVFYSLLVDGRLSKPIIPPNKNIYTWKDVVKINGNIYAEEAPISGEMDDDGHYQIDEFMDAVAKKYKVSVDDIQTYMMDDIHFNAENLPFDAEACGCYINGIGEWLI